MGMYFNPSNDGFKQALRSQIYVDKTGMIEFFNKILDSEQKFTAVSRARRFGKSMAAKLLIAYYSKGCDSRELFKGLKAETLPSFIRLRKRLRRHGLSAKTRLSLSSPAY